MLCHYGYLHNVSDHITTHLNSALRMLLVVVQARDAIVTVSENFDSLTAIFLEKRKCDLIRVNVVCI